MISAELYMEVRNELCASRIAQEDLYWLLDMVSIYGLRTIDTLMRLEDPYYYGALPAGSTAPCLYRGSLSYKTARAVPGSTCANGAFTGPPSPGALPPGGDAGGDIVPLLPQGDEPKPPAAPPTPPKSPVTAVADWIKENVLHSLWWPLIPVLLGCSSRPNPGVIIGPGTGSPPQQLPPGPQPGTPGQLPGPVTPPQLPPGYSPPQLPAGWTIPQFGGGAGTTTPGVWAAREQLVGWNTPYIPDNYQLPTGVGPADIINAKYDLQKACRAVKLIEAVMYGGELAADAERELTWDMLVDVVCVAVDVLLASKTAATYMMRRNWMALLPYAVTVGCTFLTSWTVADEAASMEYSKAKGRTYSKEQFDRYELPGAMPAGSQAGNGKVVCVLSAPNFGLSGFQQCAFAFKSWGVAGSVYDSSPPNIPAGGNSNVGRVKSARLAAAAAAAQGSAGQPGTAQPITPEPPWTTPPSLGAASAATERNARASNGLTGSTLLRTRRRR